MAGPTIGRMGKVGKKKKEIEKSGREREQGAGTGTGTGTGRDRDGDWIPCSMLCSQFDICPISARYPHDIRPIPAGIECMAMDELA